MLQAFNADTQELDVDLLLLSAPTATYKGKLKRADVSGEALPDQNEVGESEPVVKAWVRISGEDIPEGRGFPASCTWPKPRYTPRSAAATTAWATRSSTASGNSSTKRSFGSSSAKALAACGFAFAATGVVRPGCGASAKPQAANGGSAMRRILVSVALGVLTVLSLAACGGEAVPSATRSTTAASPGEASPLAVAAVEGEQPIGGPLFKVIHVAPANPDAAPPNRKSMTDPVVVNDARFVVIDRIEVPSQREGVLLVIGTQLDEPWPWQLEEKVPADRLVIVKYGNVEKRYRRLKEGDIVKAGQSDRPDRQPAGAGRFRHEGRQDPRRHRRPGGHAQDAR